jgi:transcription elongation factor
MGMLSAPSAPMISRLQPTATTANTLNSLSKRNFVTSLRQIPVRKYSTSSLASDPSALGANASVSALDASTSVVQDREPASSEGAPVCAICIEAYADGDEILTLACSHCFHSDCASKWFFQHCLNTTDLASAFSCPQCRQDHVALSEASSQPGSEATGTGTTLNGIATQSFLQIGQTLAEGGYDFLSDCTSEAPVSVVRKLSPAIDSVGVVAQTDLPSAIAASDASPASAREAQLRWSTYSDCGVPLASPSRK